MDSGQVIFRRQLLGIRLVLEEILAEALGGLSEYKMLCSNIAPEAIRMAIEDWRQRSAELAGPR